jgi:hypothetical protein
VVVDSSHEGFFKQAALILQLNRQVGTESRHLVEVHPRLPHYFLHIHTLREHFFFSFSLESGLLFVVALFIRLEESFLLNRLVFLKHIESQALFLFQYLVHQVIMALGSFEEVYDALGFVVLMGLFIRILRYFPFRLHQFANVDCGGRCLGLEEVGQVL